MSYLEKIEENKRVLKKCTDINAYNVGASRSYYCAFLSMKNFLTSKNFDYKFFLKEIGRQDEREYSHGTIKQALFRCLLSNGYTLREISSLNKIDNLYFKRRIADYKKKNITENEFNDSLAELNAITSIIGAM